jgi:hypothetical protein
MTPAQTCASKMVIVTTLCGEPTTRGEALGLCVSHLHWQMPTDATSSLHVPVSTSNASRRVVHARAGLVFISS